ncbi:hypothetical protein AB0E01_22965 [Nocardia vinacea]
MAQCKTMFCIAEEHEGGEHVDMEGTTWVDDVTSPHGYTITHTNYDPWTD